MSESKIIVLDDDPTGCQTVHSCLLLTRWEPEDLETALRDAAPLFFVLTNTRALDARQAAEITRDVCRNLKTALARLARAGRPIQPILVSRSDSTLRGHYPIETDILSAELGPFDAHFLVPAFFEGGRVTIDGVHYLTVDGRRVPVHETEFARDAVFGFRHSYLPDYVAEKTGGRIPASAVIRLGLEALRADSGPPLMALRGNVCVAVDAERQDDLDRFATALRAATAAGKRFLLRSAASVLTSLAQLPPQPVAAEDLRRCVRHGRVGAVIVGSHVAKTSAQLTRLLAEPDTAAIEIDVERVTHGRDALLTSVLARASAAVADGLAPVIYTSRTEKRFADHTARLAFGARVSALLVDVVRGLPPGLGFLITKGGITSNDVLGHGLQLRAARVLGQVLAGCPILRCPGDHPRFPDLPVVIFPGNVGDDAALTTVFRRLAAPLAAHRSAS